eukprot:TRINITY_DN7939_c0_g1_i5.p2 TRINITY_DN7939_c0_g1~~TRINITY_DN7939_c0_g1_i5.p2  ORF type:complete len:151 (+),score=40.01 TRINITY_DN7939_c0_g1_i5:932-1384(+)
MAGTSSYRAPEILKGEAYTKDVDWWSLGVMIYEMITGYCPFHGEDEVVLHSQILSAQIEFTGFWSPHALDFVQSLLTREPRKRPTSKQMKKHPWFVNLDWKKLSKKQMTPPFLPSPYELSKFPPFGDQVEGYSLSSIDDFEGFTYDGTTN